MTQHFHALIWLDHREAHVFGFNAEDFDKTEVKPPRAIRQLRRKDGSITDGKTPVDPGYYREIADAVGTAGEVVIVGPGSAKLDLVKYLHKHHLPLADKVIGVETVDHPTDRQLIAYGRAYFAKADKMLPQNAG